MDFELSKEQIMLQEMVRDFAEKEIEPYAREVDETGKMRMETFQKLGNLGLLGIPFPENTAEQAGIPSLIASRSKKSARHAGEQGSAMPQIQASAQARSTISAPKNRSRSGSFRWQKAKRSAHSGLRNQTPDPMPAEQGQKRCLTAMNG